MSKQIKKQIALILTVLIIAFSFSLSGCNFSRSVKDVSFSQQQLNLKIGDEYDIASMIVITPAKATNKSYTLQSSDESTVSIEGSVIKALKYGEADITVTTSSKGYTAVLNVYCDYVNPSELALKAEGKLLQYVNDTTNINFTAQIHENADPDLQINWSVNNEFKNTGKTFQFMPQSGTAAIYEIDAEISQTSISDKLFVRVYNTMSSMPVLSVENEAELEQNQDDNKNIVFNVDYESDESNPEDFIVWTVNDQIKQQGNLNTFEFRPLSAGIYRVSVSVNGYSAKTETNMGFLTAYVRGSLSIENLRADWDNPFPDVVFSWDELPDDLDVQFKIKNIITGVQNEYYIRTNEDYAQDFYLNSFTARGIIDLMNYSYQVSARVLGNGGIFKDGDYCQSLTLNKINDASAFVYLQNKYFGGNYYITSDLEFFDVNDYQLVFRKGVGTESYAVYMAYTSQHTISQLLSQAFNRSLFTGEYNTGIQTLGNIVRIEIEFLSVNNPESYNGESQRNSRNNLNAFIPHINFDTDKNRPQNYIFPVDNKNAIALNVETGEQLYLVLERGARPVVKAGSQAEELYNYVKDVLRQICIDDMSDFEKAHAIYDWIMWRVNYDYETAYQSKYTSIAQATKLSAYYIDSVFTKNRAGDIPSFSVCDGISKAYAVMCNIEGIECIRVGGVALRGAESSGHAWNKINIDGNWYVVDCTWGDYTSTLSGKTYEFASHEYLFLTDNQIQNTHKENIYADYPTADTEYNYFSQYIDQNQSVDLYLSNTAQMAQEIYKIIEYSLNNIMPQNYNGTFLMPGNNGISDTAQWFGIEIKIAQNLSMNDQIIFDYVKNAFAAYDSKGFKIDKVKNNYTMQITSSQMLQLFVRL